MSTFYSSNLDLGGMPKSVVVINYKKEEEKATESKKVNSLHHIHLLDRSWSMSGEIGALVENVKKTLDVMNENDYVSIVWFSSAGEYRTIIKGAKKDENTYKLLDSIKSCVGLTCFSEALQEVGDIINDLETICPNFNVTLFTDGYPVTSWSDEEERSAKAVEVWKEKVLALNTVGYGNYYNQEFLKSLSEKTAFGQMIHSSQIDEYVTIWTENFERVSDLVLDNVEITAEGCEILYLNSKTTKMTNDSIHYRALENKKNQFIILGDTPIIKFEMNGKTYSSEDITTKIPKPTTTALAYAYAYENYYKNTRQVALDILARTLNDKYLVDTQINAFTFDEVAEYTKQLKKAVFSSKGRLIDGECDKDYLPKADAPCLMDILATLTSNKNYYVYSTEYTKIGLKTMDTFNLFKKSKERVITPLNSIIVNKDKLNISIQSTIKGTVSLNPKQADKVDLPREVDSFMFRNQTIVKDGIVHLETITVIVDDITLADLKTLNIPNFIVSEKSADLGTELVINLKAVPIINRMYLNNSKIERVLDNTATILTLEARQKVLNALIKKINENSPNIESVTAYTLEQLEILKEHGLDSSLLYKGVDLKVEDKEGKDYYEAKSFKFQIKGYATLPSLKDVVSKVNESKKLNGPATLMKDYLMDLQQEVNENSKVVVSLLSDDINFEGDKYFLENELKLVKEELMKARIEVFSIKLAKVLTGDWFENVIADNKGNYLYTKDDVTLVIKATKEKVYFS